MVLDKEQLSVLLLELEDGVLDRLDADLRNLRNELDFMKSEEAHRDMIKTVALRSPALDAGTAGNDKSEDMFFRLVKQMAERDGVTEQLKADNQMEWVARMNNIRSRATEIVNHDIIYN